MTMLQNKETLQHQLKQLLIEKSWKQGPVTLSSGKVSTFYVDCKQTVLHAQGAYVVGQLVMHHIHTLEQQGLHIHAAGGLSLGADPLAVATAVISYSIQHPIHAFILRKEPKSHGTAAWLEGRNNVPPGSNVLILEDVVTTGGSTLKAIERAKIEGLVPVAILALLDREEGGRQALEATGLPFASLLTRSELTA